MLVLGIDTSCDDTSAAVVENGTTVKSLVVTSQDEFHSRYGGVVPEIASRKHIDVISATIEEALLRAGISFQSIDAVAVTSRPGLIGSLVVGIATAKSIAYSLNIPLVDVNHIQGHAYALAMENDLSFPHCSLIVSGGHTLTALVHRDWSMEVLGHTRDDAAGECLDKVAKMLHLGYPGGPVIDKMAKTGDPTVYNFPRPMLNDSTYDFSFSGLKTAVKLKLQSRESPLQQENLRDFVASVQEAVVDVLIKKTVDVATQKGISLITVGGGVAANSRLREKFRATLAGTKMTVLFPKPIMCTDNAAVIAGLGYQLLQQGKRAGLQLNAQARITLD